VHILLNHEGRQAAYMETRASCVLCRWRQLPAYLPAPACASSGARGSGSAAPTCTCSRDCAAGTHHPAHPANHPAGHHKHTGTGELLPEACKACKARRRFSLLWWLKTGQLFFDNVLGIRFEWLPSHVAQWNTTLL
jgi:hypothetical protein